MMEIFDCEKWSLHLDSSEVLKEILRYFIAYSLHALCVPEQYKTWNIPYRESSKKVFVLWQVNKLHRLLQYYLYYG